MYPVPNHHVVVQPEVKTRSHTKLIICAAVSITLVVMVVIVGVGLGVGLGIGLRKKSSTPSSNTNAVLSAPNVNCTYIDSSTCGCATVKPTFLSSRIVNGYTAIPHSWPWTVALYYNNALRCEGFLVTYEHVLTAAHCVIDLTLSQFEVYAGIHSRSSLTDRQIRAVSVIKTHPNYSASTLLNDIAVLKLITPLTTTMSVGLCCLPSDLSLPIQNEPAVIVGWGRTREADASSVSDTLQQAVVAIRQCVSSLYLDRQFCAANGRNDACQGDSGGPLMTNVNNAWTCTGIVSYGVGCGNGGYYTRVSYYRSFIDNAILTM